MRGWAYHQHGELRIDVVGLFEAGWSNTQLCSGPIENGADPDRTYGTCSFVGAGAHRAGFLSGLCTTSVSMVGFGSTLPSPQDDALRTFLPETAIKMVKTCHPRGGAREAGPPDGAAIAPNPVPAHHAPPSDLTLRLPSSPLI